MRTWICAITLAGIFFLGSLPLVVADPAEPASTPKEKITLEIAAVMDTQPTVLVCSLRNEDTVEFAGDELRIEHSGLVIKPPDGRERWAKGSVTNRPVVVKPSQTITWRINDLPLVLRVLGQTTELGTYHIYWRVGEWRSNEITFLKEQKNNVMEWSLEELNRELDRLAEKGPLTPEELRWRSMVEAAQRAAENRARVEKMIEQQSHPQR